MMTLTLPLGLVASLQAATLYIGNHDEKSVLDWGIHTSNPYASPAGMFLQRNRKFTIGRVKSSLVL